MTPNWAYTPPLRTFVDGLPGLGPENANNLGQFLSVAKPLRRHHLTKRRYADPYQRSKCPSGPGGNAPRAMVGRGEEPCPVRLGVVPSILRPGLDER